MPKEVYYSDLAIRYRSLDTVMRKILRFGPLFAERVEEGFSREEAFKVVFCQIFPETRDQFAWYREIHDRYRRLHATEDAMVLEDLGERLLEFTLRTIMDTAERYFPYDREALDLHDDVKAAWDPIQLFEDASEHISDIARAHRLDQRYTRDARMVCASMMCYAWIELMEPLRVVKLSLADIQRIMSERFFDPHELRQVYMVVVRDANNRNRVMGTCTDDTCQDESFIDIFHDEESAKVREEELRAQGLDARAELLAWDLRVAVIDGKQYCVYHRRRPKEQGSTFRKLVSGRDISDRRGFIYVVVAVEHDGVHRLATRADAERFMEAMLDRVWLPADTPFELGWHWREPREHGENADNGHHYHHFQIKGRHLLEVNGRLVAGSVEMAAQTLGDYLNGSRPGTPEFHGARRKKQLIPVIEQRYPHIKTSLLR